MLVFPRYSEGSAGPHKISNVKSLSVTKYDVYSSLYDDFYEIFTLKCTLEDDKILTVRNVIDIEIL